MSQSTSIGSNNNNNWNGTYGNNWNEGNMNAYKNFNAGAQGFENNSAYNIHNMNMNTMSMPTALSQGGSSHYDQRGGNSMNNSRYNGHNGNAYQHSNNGPNNTYNTDLPPPLTPEESELMHRLSSLCDKHRVDRRTIDWFTNNQHKEHWERLVCKIQELDRRSQEPGGSALRVKNPSAWMTKFFNTIRNSR